MHSVTSIVGRKRFAKRLILVVILIAAIIAALYWAYVSSQYQDYPGKLKSNKNVKKLSHKFQPQDGYHVADAKVNITGTPTVYLQIRTSPPNDTTIVNIDIKESNRTRAETHTPPEEAATEEETAKTTEVEEIQLPSQEELQENQRKMELKQQNLSKQDVAPDLQAEIENYKSCLETSFSSSKTTEDINFPELEETVRKHCFKRLFGDEHGNICKWPSRDLVGPLYVDMKALSFKIMSSTMLKFVRRGGTWKPKRCIPRQKLAVIIPFRDRAQHLAVLLRQLHGILRRQELMYRILVIEQDDDYPFNRGKLMNVGFQEALKIANYTCFVYHDVDLIPENDLNDYGCPESPRHVSSNIDKFDYRLPYPGIFGGVEMFLREDYERVNGFSNSYWGWGAEDDDLYKRVTEHGYKLSRPSSTEGRYKMIKHGESGDKNPSRHRKLVNARDEFQTDGISSLQYTVLRVKEEQLYTHIKVDLNMEEDMIY